MLTDYQKQLIIDNYESVRAMAYTQHKSLHPSTDVNDLIGDGAIGLIDAAIKYDPNKCGNFMGYAHIRIYGEMMCGLRNWDWMTRGARERDKKSGKNTAMVYIDGPDQLFFKTAGIEESVIDRQTVREAFQFFDKLPERWRAIMNAIYKDNLTFKEVGKIFGVNESRISQIHGEIIKKLKIEMGYN